MSSVTVSVENIMEPPSKKSKVEDTPDNNDTCSLQPNNKFSQDFDVNEGLGSSGFVVSEDKCMDYVTPEEYERLHQFQVLDEVRSDDGDSDQNEQSDSSDGKSEGVPEEEIEKMLEEDLPDDLKGAPKPKEKPFIMRQKVVLEEKGVNHFEVLPLDWMMVRHYSGIPVYMHRSSRVCTLAKPYFLGTGNTRRHDIPLSAIPCLAYRRALEEEEKQKEIDKQIEEQIKNGTWQQQTDSNNEKAKKTVSDATGDVVNGVSDVDNTKINSNNTLETNNVHSAEKVNSDLGTANKLSVSKCPFSHKKEHESSENVPNIANNVDNGGLNTTEQTTEHSNVDEASIDGNETAIEVSELVDDNIENQGQNMTVEQNDNETNDNQNHREENGENETNEGIEKGADGNKGTQTVDDIPLNRKPVLLPGGQLMPPPRVECAASSWKCQHLAPEQVTDYCRALFRFNTLKIMHFKRWADRRKYTKARKALQNSALPEGTKLITIPAAPQTDGLDATVTGRTRRDWVMNMNGRSYLSVFHEYVRRALQKQPVYEFKQLENASAPYQATVYIGGMQYGVGTGSSKRAAKANAATASIHILIPEMRGQMHPPDQEPDFSFFDCVGIEDPRITEFCAATCEPSPHAILRTCLLRNFGAGDRHIHTEMKKLEYQKIELTMRVGRHSATVVCKNKKSAKQRASQAILQLLHPHVRSWGSLLRLYGSRSVKSCKEKKLEEQQITLLQDSARQNEPNYAVLEKLRNEMRKLRERDEAVVPIGTLPVKDDLPTHSGSNLNNVDL